MKHLKTIPSNHGHGRVAYVFSVTANELRYLKEITARYKPKAVHDGQEKLKNAKRSVRKCIGGIKVIEE